MAAIKISISEDFRDLTLFESLIWLGNNSKDKFEIELKSLDALNKYLGERFIDQGMNEYLSDQYGEEWGLEEEALNEEGKFYIELVKSLDIDFTLIVSESVDKDDIEFANLVGIKVCEEVNHV